MTSSPTPRHSRPAAGIARLWQYLPDSWTGDLNDAKVRAEIVVGLNKNRIMAVITHCLASAAYYWAYDFVRNSYWLCGVLLAWCAVAFWQYGVEKQIQARLAKKPLSESDSIQFLLFAIFTSGLSALGLSITMVAFLVHDPSGLNSPAVFGALIYYFAAIVKNISVKLLCMIYSIVVLLPMGTYFLWQQGTPSLLIGIFILTLCMVMASFSKAMGQTITSQIRQNYTLEALALSLQAERDRADAASSAKSRFFTAASHDARQPLQAISLLYDSIAISTTMHPQDRRLIDKIGTNLHSIRNLFNQVLDISRIDTGSVAPQYQAVRLQDLFNTLDAQMGGVAASKNLWLRFVPTPVVVWHDAQLLERMVGNLIHNALKFTGQGGVWIAYRAGRGVLEVRDSGIGIEADQQSQIFEEFYQLDNTARNRNDNAGLGLGLSIVKRLAVLTGTQLGIRSAPAKGSTFWIKLLTTDAPLPQPAPKTSASIHLHHGHALLAGHRILLVEDDAELRTLFMQRLNAHGAQVTACHDAAQACAQLHSADYDAVITDYRLGNSSNGIEVAQLARQRLGNAAPVIVITGDTSSGTFKALAEQPNTWVLHKPIAFDQLLACLARN